MVRKDEMGEMNVMKEKIIYSRIPSPVWHWLDVNEAVTAKPLPKAGKAAVSQDKRIRPQTAMSAEDAALAAKVEMATTRQADEAIEKYSQQRFFLDVPNGKKEIEPIYLNFDFLSEGGFYDDIFIKSGEGSQAEVVLLYTGRGGCHGGRLRVHIGKNASLHLCLAQFLADDMVNTDSIGVRAEAGADFSFTAIEAGAAASDTALLAVLAGEKSRADCEIFYLGTGSRRQDMNYIMRQEGRASEARLNVHGVLQGKSSKIFRGTLDFRRGSKKSRGREKEEVLLLDKEVRNRSVPLMLSAEDEIEGHHAVSAGRLDEAKLFYLQSRGLDKAQARRLFVAAAATPALDRLPKGAFRQKIADFLERRLPDV